jgi:subtilisin family serine protease
MLVVTDVTRSRSGAATAASLRKADSDLEQAMGLSIAHSSDVDTDRMGGELDAAVTSDQAVMLDDLGIVVMEAHEENEARLAAAIADTRSVVRVAERERVVWAISDYLTGFQQGVNALADSMRHHGAVPAAGGPAALPGGPFDDDAVSTWGLKAVGATGSADVGDGARVAVLDTGVDLTHPDLVHAVSPDRSQSFVSGEAVDDGHGHGTHCCGTVAGRIDPGVVPRYGVAPETQLWVGKVLSNAGSGGDAGILAGIQWAIQQDCHVISMSLGAAVAPGTPFSQVYEQAARAALARNTVIVAAAGNSSNRPFDVGPIGHPANCPSIVAVAAVDQALAPARFSDAGRVGVGHVGVAGPGVQVLSAAPGGGHRQLSGTSMATPHAAGVAAAIYGRELAEGPELAMRLMLQAQGLTAAAVDVGAGCVSVSP